MHIHGDDLLKGQEHCIDSLMVMIEALRKELEAKDSFIKLMKCCIQECKNGEYDIKDLRENISKRCVSKGIVEL